VDLRSVKMSGAPGRAEERTPDEPERVPLLRIRSDLGDLAGRLLP
jgi:hypothetical protein